MMESIFPDQAWVQAFEDKLNSDLKYRQVASKWEGDILFVIEPDDVLEEKLEIYLNLWHGACLDAYFLTEGMEHPEPRFTLQAPYHGFKQVLMGHMHPMTALTTRKLRLTGDLMYMVRNVPVVLDFVRCAQEITTRVLE